jgi:hypothetical protein
MKRGDFLYVRWRVKATNQIHEERVDLRSRLPYDLNQKTVYFIAQGDQLQIFLIPPFDERRPTGSPPIGPRLYQHLRAVRIFPDQ